MVVAWLTAPGHPLLHSGTNTHIITKVHNTTNLNLSDYAFHVDIFSPGCHAEYHVVESLDTDDNKYKRKSPLAMLAKWAR